MTHARTSDRPAIPALPHVFQIGSGWFPHSKGGAENVFHNVWQGLPAAGFTVGGIVPGPPDLARRTGGAIDGFDADASWPRRALAIRAATAARFRADPPDLVASHFALYALPILDRLARTPLVTHFHGPWALESRNEGAGALSVKVKRSIEALVYRRSDRLVVLSRAFADLLVEQHAVDRDRIRLVPGGVDCDRFDPPASRDAARRALGWDPGRPAILTVRRLVRRMGLDRLIDAMAILRNGPAAARDAVLHIAGTGRERAALQARAAARGLENHVVFEGFVPDDRLPLAYRAADLTLIPTATLEGFGLVAVESLAAGTPVLATDVGGLPEIVSPLSQRMVLGGTDDRGIADAIGACLADPNLLPDQDACRRYARVNFDWSVITPRIAAVYHELL
jgi:glycosyltransferase involved in cell wall biosynthesis